jgi:hypothetical protein
VKLLLRQEVTLFLLNKTNILNDYLSKEYVGQWVADSKGQHAANNL